jgi:hypothetical protein
MLADARWQSISWRTGTKGQLVPHDSEAALLGALAIAVAPAALVVALNPRYSAATFTAVVVFLAPSITQAGPIASAVERVLERRVVGLFVSLVVLPGRAHDLAIEAAAHIDLMTRLLPELFAGFTRSLNQTALHAMQNRIGAAFARLDAVVVETRHERMTRLAAEPDQAPAAVAARPGHDRTRGGHAAARNVPGAARTTPRARPGSRSSSPTDCPGRYSTGWYFASARSFTILRATRIESTATRRSSSVER